jgi:type II secretion system protein H
MAKDRRKTRQGFTLMEVLLVLALMAVIAAIAWPVLRNPFAGHRLRAAADQVRSEWFQARGEAMRSGHIYSFRYQVGGDRFHTLSEDAPPPSDDKTLPDGIKFFDDEVRNDDLSALSPDAEMESLEDMADGWSDPIFFYPDGTTSDVRLVLAGDQSRAVCVMLRGITGTASVTDLASIME